MPPSSLGDFEQLVLLAVLQLGDDAYAASIRSRIEEAAERRVTRGALYATLDRLVDKEFLDWDVEDSTPARGGIPRRRFWVSEDGMTALRRSYRAVRNLAHGLDRVLREV